MTRKISLDKILIVDDEERMCQSLARILSDLGYQAKALSEPAAAVREVESDSYDLVLTDIKMPGLDGFDLLRAAKGKDKDSIVVFMTGYGSLESAVKAISLGAYDYLLKPLEIEDLKVTVRRGLEKRKSDLEKNKLLGELKVANQALEKKVKELDALYQASKSLSTTLQTEELLQKLLQLAAQVMGAKIGSIMILDEARQGLKIQASIGLDLKIVEHTVVKLGDSIAGYVAEKGTPLIVEDIESDPRFKKVNKAKYETRSLLSVPLRVKNEVIGVINLNNKADGTAFTQDDLKLLTTFASPAAVAIDDAYHYNQLKDKANQLSVLNEVARGLSSLEEFKEVTHFIFTRLKDIVPIDYCLWFDWDEREEGLTLEHGEGVLENIKSNQSQIPFGKEEIFHIEKLKQKLERRLTSPSGREIRLGSFTAVPILAEGSLHGVFCVGNSAGHSITQSQREIISIVASQATSLYERERALLNSSRLITMGNLISEITHDLKKPLTNIKTSLQILRQKRPDPQMQEELFSSAEQEVLRLAELVKELLSFSKPESYQPEKKPVAPILDKALKLIQPNLTSQKIKLDKRYTDQLPAILVNEKALLEAFLNILINAAESMLKGGALTVAAQPVSLSDPKGEFLQISIQDTGPGIPPGDLSHIWERYYTTKSGGSGLGLAIVDRTIKAHNGLIKVESQVGRGTTFHIYLPLS